MLNHLHDKTEVEILIVDDHQLFIDAIRHRIEGVWPHVSIRSETSIERCLSCFDVAPVYDIIVLDMNMPDAIGMDIVTQIQIQSPSSKILALFDRFDRDWVVGCIGAGIHGCLPKSCSFELLLSVLQLVLSNGVYVPPEILGDPQPRPVSERGTAEVPPAKPLQQKQHGGLMTSRQIEILRCLARGVSNKEIAHSLNISDGTVRIQLTTIYRALNVSNRTAALIKAGELGLL